VNETCSGLRRFRASAAAASAGSQPTGSRTADREPAGSRSARRAPAWILCIGVLGCDSGPRDDVRALGAPLHVIDINIGPGKPLAAGEAIEIAFDRLLKPNSVVRQSFVLRDAFGSNVDPPVVVYDPALQLVRIESPRGFGEEWLKPNQPYVLVLGIPRPGEELGGFRSIDDATLEANAQRNIGFFAATGPSAPANSPDAADAATPDSSMPDSSVPAPSVPAPSVPAPSVPAADKAQRFCSQIKPLLAKKCGACHATGDIAGLDLISTAGLRATLGRTARVLASQGDAVRAPAAGRIFPGDMPILAPGNASQSFLFYKVLLARPSSVATPACENPSLSRMVRVKVLADITESERASLGGKIPGTAMPPPGNPSLTTEERRNLSAWLNEGATIPDTCTCTLFP
jgi:hypothetical protein